MHVPALVPYKGLNVDKWYKSLLLRVSVISCLSRVITRNTNHISSSPGRLEQPRVLPASSAGHLLQRQAGWERNVRNMKTTTVYRLLTLIILEAMIYAGHG